MEKIYKAIVESASKEDLLLLQDLVKFRLIDIKNGVTDFSFTTEEFVFIQNKNKIALIKSVRARFKLGLKAAKDLVESHLLILGLAKRDRQNYVVIS